MKNQFVSVIIPNWNGKKLLQQCLYSLKNQSYSKFEIIIIDNGSTDGSVEFLKLKYPEINIIQFRENLGFARAVNEGIKRGKAEYIALLNNDTKADKDWLKNLVSTTRRFRKYAAVTSKMILMSGRLDSAGDTINTVGQAFHIGYNENPDKWNFPGERFLVTGGATIYRRDVFKKIGFFDEDFFAYGEDVDWCLRAQLAGYKFWYEPRAIVYHHHKATAKKIPRYVEYLQFRNMNLTILKDFPRQLFLKKLRFITIPLVHIHTIFYMAFHGFLREALFADFWILTHFPRILKKRWIIQKNRKVIIDYLDNWMEPKNIKLWRIFK